MMNWKRFRMKQSYNNREIILAFTAAGKNNEKVRIGGVPQTNEGAAPK